VVAMNHKKVNMKYTGPKKDHHGKNKDYQSFKCYKFNTAQNKDCPYALKGEEAESIIDSMGLRSWQTTMKSDYARREQQEKLRRIEQQSEMERARRIREQKQMEHATRIREQNELNRIRLIQEREREIRSENPFYNYSRSEPRKTRDNSSGCVIL